MRDESANLPCTEEQLEELRKLGRLDSDARHLRRERAAALKYRIKDFSNKSTTADIETRFDADVDRFSNLETGQTATIDAPLAMQLITEAAVRLTPQIGRVLDIGCGAGNNTLKLKEVYGKPFACDLLDLSRPMLERAKERVLQAGVETVELWKHDFRDAELPRESYMEQKHRNRLLADFPDLTKFLTIHVLDIPDDYGYLDDSPNRSLVKAASVR